MLIRRKLTYGYDQISLYIKLIKNLRIYNRNINNTVKNVPRIKIKNLRLKLKLNLKLKFVRSHAKGGSSCNKQMLS